MTVIAPTNGRFDGSDVFERARPSAVYFAQKGREKGGNVTLKETPILGEPRAPARMRHSISSAAIARSRNLESWYLRVSEALLFGGGTLLSSLFLLGSCTALNIIGS